MKTVIQLLLQQKLSIFNSHKNKLGVINIKDFNRNFHNDILNVFTFL